MRLAKISTRATHNKVIKDLTEGGYIKYEASDKRNQGSREYIGLSYKTGDYHHHYFLQLPSNNSRSEWHNKRLY
jgi:hypothetical protein